MARTKDRDTSRVQRIEKSGTVLISIPEWVQQHMDIQKGDQVFWAKRGDAHIDICRVRH